MAVLVFQGPNGPCPVPFADARELVVALRRLPSERHPRAAASAATIDSALAAEGRTPVDVARLDVEPVQHALEALRRTRGSLSPQLVALRTELGSIKP